MPRPLVSVVLATYQRRPLLERSLVCYQNQHFDNDRFELIVIDDHSTDGTRELVLDWAATTKIRATVLTAAPKPAEWVDVGWVLNHGIRAAAGDHICITHPEIMFGRRTLAEMVGYCSAGEWRYCGAKCYYLTPGDQAAIDTVPWREEGVLALRGLPDFYVDPPHGNPHYTHAVTDLVATEGYPIRTWDSWIAGCLSRESWRRLGGFWVTHKWGSCDVGFNHRRKVLGVEEWTSPDPLAIVAHENHDGPGEVPTPRDMPAWQRELDAFDKSKLMYPEVDELGW